VAAATLTLASRLNYSRVMNRKRSSKRSISRGTQPPPLPPQVTGPVKQLAHEHGLAVVSGPDTTQELDVADILEALPEPTRAAIRETDHPDSQP